MKTTKIALAVLLTIAAGNLITALGISLVHPFASSPRFDATQDTMEFIGLLTLCTAMAVGTIVLVASPVGDFLGFFAAGIVTAGCFWITVDGYGARAGVLETLVSTVLVAVTGYVIHLGLQDPESQEPVYIYPPTIEDMSVPVPADDTYSTVQRADWMN